MQLDEKKAVLEILTEVVNICAQPILKKIFYVPAP